jgi:hypothetical protein
LKKKFEKEKEKKENHSLLTFRPKRPAGPSNPSRAGPPLPLSFLFLLLSLTPGPYLSASLPPFLSSSPCSPARRRSRAKSAAPPPSPLSFSPLRARQLRQLNPHSNPRPFPLFPLPSLRPDGPPAINGKPPAASSPFRFAYLLAPLFKLALDRLRLPLPSQHTYPLARAQFPSAAASGPAAAVQAPLSVKDHLRRLSSLLFGFTRGLTSACYCRFTSLTPPGAPSPSAGAPPGSPSPRARSFASLSASTVAARSTRHGEH